MLVCYLLILTGFVEYCSKSNNHFCLRYEICTFSGQFGSVCSIEESSGPLNPPVPIVIKAPKSAGAKGIFEMIHVSEYIYLKNVTYVLDYTR